MILITCDIENGTQNESERRSIAIPESQACAASSRLRDLCSQGARHALTADEVAGEPWADFESRLKKGNFHEDMVVFVKWLYGSEHDILQNRWVGDLWCLGQRLESPTFQNAVMRRLCKKLSDRDEREIHRGFADYWSYDAQAAWDVADFTHDKEDGFDIEKDEVYWGNKQMLRFILDIFAFLGTSNTTVRKALHKGGSVAVQLSMLIEA